MTLLGFPDRDCTLAGPSQTATVGGCRTESGEGSRPQIHGQMCEADLNAQSHQLLTPGGADDVACEIWHVTPPGLRFASGQLFNQGSLRKPVVLDQLPQAGRQGINLANESHVPNGQDTFVLDGEWRGEHVPGTKRVLSRNSDLGLEYVSSGQDTKQEAKCPDPLP